mmetsp:Transcript_21000/g.37926  ORF Transcript_21000/g.37926 Transcript_21000/m.37926 type:complete len:281 (+) Transcript_21000:513-1355(+)
MQRQVTLGSSISNTILALLQGLVTSLGGFGQGRSPFRRIHTRKIKRILLTKFGITKYARIIPRNPRDHSFLNIDNGCQMRKDPPIGPVIILPQERESLTRCRKDGNVIGSNGVITGRQDIFHHQFRIRVGNLEATVFVGFGLKVEAKVFDKGSLASPIAIGTKRETHRGGIPPFDHVRSTGSVRVVTAVPFRCGLRIDSRRTIRIISIAIIRRSPGRSQGRITRRDDRDGGCRRRSYGEGRWSHTHTHGSVRHWIKGHDHGSIRHEISGRRPLPLHHRQT